MDLTRISRKYAHVTVTATLADGSPATVTAVDVALLPPRSYPTGQTTWTAAVYTNGVATVLLAGPDAGTTAGALVVPEPGADLWARVTDTPEVDAARIDRIMITS